MDTARRRAALLAGLRSGTIRTAADAALRFEVSERTILRDVAALRDLGEPIVGEPGRGGGLGLAASARLEPVRLTTDEIIGLVLSLGVARRAAPGAPFSAAADDAVERLIAALPGARLHEVRWFLQRIAVGPPASAATAATVAPVPDGVLVAAERALTARRALTFGYTDRHGRREDRRVEPHGLLLQAPVWYLIAWDLVRHGPRLFPRRPGDRSGGARGHAVRAQGPRRAPGAAPGGTGLTCEQTP